MSEFAAASLEEPWLGLIIGNTRLHWGWFQARSLVEVWHTAHASEQLATRLIAAQFNPFAWRSLAADGLLPPDIPTRLESIMPRLAQPIPLYCASVVPQQTQLWESYSHFQSVRLTDLPLAGLYPTLGIDRALSLLGAGNRYGWPVLVIDAGTALTFTAGDAGRLLGGAILPGLATQVASLTQNTANLPATSITATLPPRWASNTPDAIRSGVTYGLLAAVRDFLQNWYAEQPSGTAVITGGDSAKIWNWLARSHSPWSIHQDADLAFHGLSGYRHYAQVRDHSP